VGCEQGVDELFFTRSIVSFSNAKACGLLVALRASDSEKSRTENKNGDNARRVGVIP